MFQEYLEHWRVVSKVECLETAWTGVFIVLRITSTSRLLLTPRSSRSKSTSRIKSVALDKSSPLRSRTVPAIDAHGALHCVGAFLIIETNVGSGAGIVRLVQDNGIWKAFTLFTFLRELAGYGENVGKKRPKGVDYGEHLSRKNWLDRRKAEENFEEGQEPTVLILGESSLLNFQAISNSRQALDKQV